MDMLAGYGSGSEDESDTVAAAQAQEAATNKQQSVVDAASKAPAAPEEPAAAKKVVQLPSPDMLFGDSGQQAPGSKRAFTAVTGHSLPKSTSHSKASKEHSGSKPGSGGKQAASGSSSGMLVPPQLRGRSNVVTEDLDKLFSKKSSPARKRETQQQQPQQP